MDATAGHDPTGAMQNVIDKLRRQPKPGVLTEQEIHNVVVQSRLVLLQQPMLLEIQAPLKVCGDIHGQFTDLLRLFDIGGYPPDSSYLFLGDYVDRGKQSLEVSCLLLAYKVKYPNRIYLLRGNHECKSINYIYGFYDECKRRYSIKLWKSFVDCFNCLPVAAIIDEKIFCMHGGLSPELNHMDQIRTVIRPTDIPDKGLLCDLLWADPSPDVAGWGENDRGVSYMFGANVVRDFLLHNDLELICRAHQVVEDGYEFFAARHLVTVFSAPNYCGEFENAGAMMSVDDSLMCSFQILEGKAKLRAKAIAAERLKKAPANSNGTPHHMTITGSTILPGGIRSVASGGGLGTSTQRTGGLASNLMAMRISSQES